MMILVLALIPFERSQKKLTFIGPRGLPVTQTPTSPDTRRLKNKYRTILDLSQHVRSIQAKVHLFTAELEDAIGDESFSCTRDRFHDQYAMIEKELQGLSQDWQREGKTLKSMWDERSLVRSNRDKRLSIPQSPTTSLGGRTAVEESPQGPHQHPADSIVPESCSSARSSTSDEQIFEAVALPPQRGRFSREERIANRKEEQIEAALAREKAQANAHMIKELQSVVKLRPKVRTTSS